VPRMDLSRTLIIKPSSLGDVVQALPVLTALKEAHPRAYVAWLVATPLVDLLEGHPRLDEVIPFDRKRFGHLAWNARVAVEFARFLRELRRRRFTTVIDLQGLLRSGFMALATGAPDRIGFAAARELAPWFYTARVEVPHPDTHAVDRYLRVAQAAGLALPRATDHLPVTAEQRRRARALLAPEGVAADEPYLVVGADARWATKQWPPERYARVVDRARTELGAKAVLIGGADAKTAARRICEAAAHPPIDLTQRTTLKELVGVMAEARAAVTNDSGPMHVAAAVETPVVAIFGPTHPLRTGPYGTGHRVLSHRAPCAPCYRRQCVYGGGEAMACMARITADEVADLVAEVWRGAKAAGRSGGDEA